MSVKKTITIQDIRKYTDTYESLPSSYPSRAAAYKAVGFSSILSKSSKLEKSLKKDNVYSPGIYLIPADGINTLLGRTDINLCPFASPECKDACLVNSGRVIMDVHNVITAARQKRTALWVLNRPLFMWILEQEILAERKKAEKAGFRFAVRLNGTSDNNVKLYKTADGMYLLDKFSDVMFYDYTKNPGQIANARVFDNYHVTWSYTGHIRNKELSLKYIEQGINVAVVFEGDLPTTFNGREVINGDVSDYRPDDAKAKDGKGIYVGLVAKRIKGGIKYQIKNESGALVNNPFIIRLDDPRRG